MCTLPKKPVMKVVYEDDIRLWRSPAVDQYLALQEFVKSTFDLRVFYLQFMDDEQDRITIASQLDLEHAVEFSAAENLKSLKILVSKGCLHRVPLETSDGSVLCFCGAQFEQMGTGNAYSRGSSVFCDGCNRECGKSSQVYHCVGNRNNLHPHGYDLCLDCYASHSHVLPPLKKEVVQEESNAEAVAEAVVDGIQMEMEIEMNVFAPAAAAEAEEEVVSDEEDVPQSFSPFANVEIVDGASGEASVVEVLEENEEEDEDEDEDEEEVSVSVEMDMELEEFDMDEKDSNVESVQEPSLLSNLLKIANLEIMAEVSAEEVIEYQEESSAAAVVEAEEEEDVKPFEFETELNLMLEMGFTDVARLQQMLVKYHGSVQQVFMEMY